MRESFQEMPQKNWFIRFKDALPHLFQGSSSKVFKEEERVRKTEVV